MTNMVRGRTYRLHNRRVSLGRIDSGGYVLRFKRLDGREVKTQEIGVSEEAMRALAILYALDMADAARGESP